MLTFEWPPVGRGLLGDKLRGVALLGLLGGELVVADIDVDDLPLGQVLRR